MGSSCSTVQKPRRASVTSPNKEEPLNGENAVTVLASGFSLKRSEFGSKEDTFFDSRAWLDSDCDDDFFSVNGDFTPSRGSTPNNQFSIPAGAKSDKTFALNKFLDPKLEPSPSPSPTGRKRLSDLFQETEEPDASCEKPESRVEHDSSIEVKSEGPPESASGELAESKLKIKKKAGGKTAQCCLPSLSHSFSFSERRQKQSSVQCSA